MAGKTAVYVLRLYDLISSGSWSALNSNDSHGMYGNKDGGDREAHWPAGIEHRHRVHCRDGCRAAHANFDVPVADVDQKPNQHRRMVS